MMLPAFLPCAMRADVFDVGVMRQHHPPPVPRSLCSNVQAQRVAGIVGELDLQPEFFASLGTNNADLGVDLGGFFVVGDLKSKCAQRGNQLIVEFFNSHGFAPSLVIGAGQSSPPLW